MAEAVRVVLFPWQMVTDAGLMLSAAGTFWVITTALDGALIHKPFSKRTV